MCSKTIVSSSSVIQQFKALVQAILKTFSLLKESEFYSCLLILLGKTEPMENITSQNNDMLSDYQKKKKHLSAEPQYYPKNPVNYYYILVLQFLGRWVWWNVV